MRRIKKRTIFWFVFLLTGIVLMISNRCKAEAFPWTPPDWITSEDPIATPEPLPTPSPRAGVPSVTPTPAAVDERGVSLDANRGSLGWKTGYYVRNSAESTGTITWTSVNGGGSTSFPLTPWGSYHFSNFTSVTTNNNPIVPFNQALGLTNFPTGYSSVSARRNGISLELRYSPQVSLDGKTEWTNENTFNFYLMWPLNVNLSMVAVEGVPTLADMGISQSTITTQIPVTVFFGIQTSGGAYYWLQKDTTVAGLYNFTYSFALDMVPDDVFVNRIDVHVVVNYIYRDNPLYYKYSEWYVEQEAAAEYYPSMVFVNFASPSCSLSCSYTETAKNRNWLQRLLTWLFVPDQSTINEIINRYVSDPSAGSGGVVMSFRELLYNLAIDANEPGLENTSITIPSIDIPIGRNQTAHVMDQRSFSLYYYLANLGNKMEDHGFPNILDAIHFIFSCLMVSAFFSSLWAVLTRWFGLNLWSGVNGESIDETDLEE